MSTSLVLYDKALLHTHNLIISNVHNYSTFCKIIASFSESIQINDTTYIKVKHNPILQELEFLKLEPITVSRFQETNLKSSRIRETWFCKKIFCLEMSKTSSGRSWVLELLSLESWNAWILVFFSLDKTNEILDYYFDIIQLSEG